MVYGAARSLECKVCLRSAQMYMSGRGGMKGVLGAHVECLAF